MLGRCDLTDHRATRARARAQATTQKGHKSILRRIIQHITQTTILALAPALAVLVFAGQGARADERLWANCRTCHMVTAPDGTQLARGGRSGPNLFALAGRPMGSDPSFRLYSDALAALGATGRRWTEGDFVAYLANPDQFLQSATGNASARSDMHVAMRQGGPEIWAYLKGLAR